ncbi:MAG: hypothetical protein HY735_08310 [Verrucomicrobia bacterium]|nr:hypothetical protein [Verrucomicrobiota bacterium]
MEKLEIEIYSRSLEGAVVRLPGRRLPGLVLEGDSLSIVFNFVKSILERVQEGSDEELIAWAQELKDLVQWQLYNYEEVMGQHGLELPYPGPLGKDQP